MSGRRIPLGLCSTSCARPGEEVVAAERVRVDAFYPDQLVVRSDEDWELLKIGGDGEPWHLASDRTGVLGTVRLDPWPPVLELGSMVYVRARYRGRRRSGGLLEACLLGTTEMTSPEVPWSDAAWAGGLSSIPSTLGGVRPNEVVTLRFEPRAHERFVPGLEVEDPTYWVIRDVRIGGSSLLADTGDLPAEMFSGDPLLRPPLGLVVPGSEVEVDAVYIGPRERADLACSLCGPVVLDGGDDEVLASFGGVPALMSLSSGVPIYPRSMGQLTGWVRGWRSVPGDLASAGHAFRPERFVIRDADDWTIGDLKVGVVSQLAGCSDIPGTIFARDVVGSLRLAPVRRRDSLSLTATYVGPEINGALLICGVAGVMVPPLTDDTERKLDLQASGKREQSLAVPNKT